MHQGRGRSKDSSNSTEATNTGSNSSEFLGTGRMAQPLRLGVFDIDGTLRTARDPWIHLHEHLGFATEAHEHKELFFADKISYQEWVDRDAALWKGFSKDQILAALQHNPLKAGATELLGWFRSRNIPLVGISTGLDVFNQVIAREFGFKYMHSNELLFDDHGVCTGEAVIHVREDCKGPVLLKVLKDMRIDPSAVVVFGDGSADIAMFQIAGLSIAVSPSKDAIRNAASHCLDNGPLTQALPLLKSAFLVDDTQGS